MVTLSQAKQVSDFLVNSIQPLAVILFGSVSTNGIGEDLDLLVVVDDSEVSPLALEKAVRRKLRPFYAEFAIDPIVLPVGMIQEHWRKGSPFLRLIQREGRSLYMKDSVKQWLNQATEDLSTARYLLAGGSCRAACYHAQQAFEKAIKAALIQAGWELEKVHSIERLAAIARNYSVVVEVSDEDTVFMDSVYRGRCPAEEGLLPTGDPTASDAAKAIEITSRALASSKRTQSAVD